MALIMDMVRTVITPDVIRNASNVTGENPAATQNILKSGVPTLLAGALSQASTESGAERLRSTLTEGQFSADSVNQLTAGGAGAESLMRSGQDVVSKLFGSKTDRVTDSLAGAAGVRRDSVIKLLSMIAPIVMGVLSRQIATRNLDAKGLMNLLSSEKDSILSSVPQGVARDLDLGETVRETTHRTVREPGRTTVERERVVHHEGKKRSRVGPALIAGLAGLALLFFLTRDRRRDEVVVDVPAATERIPDAPVVTTPPMPQPVQPEVPIMAAPGGRVSEIDAFIVGTERGRREYLMEDVTFETASPELTAAAREHVNALGDVLKKGDKVKIRIEGHTDSQGDAAANRRLSKQRAEAVKKALVARGVSGAIITTVGSGSDSPVASNDTEAGRAQNRRTVLVITK